jgi:dihydroneopterin aldolase
MENDEEYFKKISDRERAIFEGSITMGALFHQFVGTPVSFKTVNILEQSIEDSMKLQPCIKKVKIKIDRKLLKDKISNYDYASLTGDMMNIKITSEYKGKTAVIRMRYVESLKYPLMYVEEVE